MRCIFESSNCLKCGCNRNSGPGPVEVAYNSTPDPLRGFEEEEKENI